MSDVGTLVPPPDGRAMGVLRGFLIAIAALAVATIIVLPTADFVLARVFWKGSRGWPRSSGCVTSG